MAKYRKCTIQRDDETKQVLLPDDQASIGKKIVIKDPDQSALWEVVDLEKLTSKEINGLEQPRA
jgi:hypothetical protein